MSSSVAVTSVSRKNPPRTVGPPSFVSLSPPTTTHSIPPPPRRRRHRRRRRRHKSHSPLARGTLSARQALRFCSRCLLPSSEAPACTIAPSMG